MASCFRQRALGSTSCIKNDPVSLQYYPHTILHIHLLYTSTAQLAPTQAYFFQNSRPTKPATMPLTSTRRTAVPRTTRTTRAKPSFKTRIMGTPRAGTRTSARHAPATTTTTTTTTKTTRTTGAGHHAAGHHGATTATHHHKRHATMGDKVSGALMKLKGSLTHRPGLKVRLCPRTKPYEVS
jgi:hypothetical protein